MRDGIRETLAEIHIKGALLGGRSDGVLNWRQHRYVQRCHTNDLVPEQVRGRGMTFDHWHIRGWLEFGRKLLDCPVRLQIKAGEGCVIIEWFALDGPLAGIPLKRVQF